jgi:hypothetical protein
MGIGRRGRKRTLDVDVVSQSKKGSLPFRTRTCSFAVGHWVISNGKVERGGFYFVSAPGP